MRSERRDCPRINDGRSQPRLPGQRAEELGRRIGRGAEAPDAAEVHVLRRKRDRADEKRQGAGRHDGRRRLGAAGAVKKRAQHCRRPICPQPARCQAGRREEANKARSRGFVGGCITFPLWREVAAPQQKGEVGGGLVRLRVAAAQARKYPVQRKQRRRIQSEGRRKNLPVGRKHLAGQLVGRPAHALALAAAVAHKVTHVAGLQLALVGTRMARVAPGGDAGGFVSQRRELPLDKRGLLRA